jgi:hypothetical protein
MRRFEGKTPSNDAPGTARDGAAAASLDKRLEPALVAAKSPAVISAQWAKYAVRGPREL